MKPRGDLRAKRQREATERNGNWAKLSLTEQLNSLDERGLTATKQRNKIKARMEHLKIKNKKG